jgi:hypothetical protein
MVPTGFVWNSPTQIQINVPAYTNLVLDTTTINTSGLANYGFSYTDETGAPPAISSIAISSDGKGVLINVLLLLAVLDGFPTQPSKMHSRVGLL